MVGVGEMGEGRRRIKGCCQERTEYKIRETEDRVINMHRNHTVSKGNLMKKREDASERGETKQREKEVAQETQGGKQKAHIVTHTHTNTRTHAYRHTHPHGGLMKYNSPQTAVQQGPCPDNAIRCRDTAKADELNALLQKRKPTRVRKIVHYVCVRLQGCTSRKTGASDQGT